jgi:hypothetical protein
MVSISITVWDVTSCNTVEVYRRYSETSVKIYKITGRHIPYDSIQDENDSNVGIRVEIFDSLFKKLLYPLKKWLASNTSICERQQQIKVAFRKKSGTE